MMKLRTTGEAAKIRNAFLNETEAQAKFSGALSLISPSAAFIFLASDIARTGLESERDFRRAIMRYRNQYGAYQDRQIEETGDYHRAFHRINENDWLPFAYRPIPLSRAVGAHLPQFMVLVLYSVLFFFGAQIAFWSQECQPRVDEFSPGKSRVIERRRRRLLPFPPERL